MFDYPENAFAWLAIASYPKAIVTNDVLGFTSAAKTSLSWAAGLTLLVCLAILGGGAVRELVRQLRKQPEGQTPSLNRPPAPKVEIGS